MKKKSRVKLYNQSILLVFILLLGGCTRRRLPEVKTLEVSNITKTTATVGVKLISDGNLSVSEIGVCWNKNGAPTISDEKKSLKISGKADYSIEITDLGRNGITYYCRAFAINEKGVSYGSEITFVTPYYAAGEDYAGGKIAYVFVPGDAGYVAGEFHGLVFDASNTNRIGFWAYDFNLVGGLDTSLGTGNANTIKIVNKYGNLDCAARGCANLVAGGYDDWYLPSLVELKKLAANSTKFNFNGYYWSSSETSNSNSARVKIDKNNAPDNGSVSSDIKHSYNPYLAFRTF